MFKLNDIFLGLFAFLLLSFVFISPSYAEWTSTPSGKGSFTAVITTDTFAGYTLKQIGQFYNSTDLYAKNTMLTNLKNAGYYVAWLPFRESGAYTTFVFSNESLFDIGADLSNDIYLKFKPFVNEGMTFYTIQSNSNDGYKRTCDTSGYYNMSGTYDFKKSTFDSMIASDENAFGSILYVKTLLSNSGYYWNGEYYFYRNITPDEPDEPTFPTNQEIADAVQKFYNSDIYKNNTNFNDFYVVYSSLKNTYAFICTNQNLFQHIYYDGVSDYYGFSSPDTWWCFYNSEGIIDSLFNNEKFNLYFIEGNSDIITNEGVGLISELCNLKFSTVMTIVYCTHDYIVYEHRPPAEGETDDQITSGTIEGDSYTYDENLDPTDSQYSPLQNFVSSNPTQSILNDVDFDSINQAFEDSKEILNIQGASWIFTANNQLVEYFIGFITLLIILLVISRIMGG